MSGETVDDISDRGRGGLTPADREFLLKTEGERREDYSRQARSDARARIRERVRASLGDFRLLADELPDEQRDEIFAAADEPRGEEYGELHQDVTKAIQFLYVGMGGESGFREALDTGVRIGELELGNISHRFDIVPQFAVDTVRRKDERAVLEAIENEEWGKLTSPPALLAFIKTAVHAGAVDLEAVSDRISRDEYVLENSDAIQEFNRQQQSDDLDDK